MAERPNILWICTDEQRFDTIHALGNERIRTPNLDRLAAEGTAFTHAYCQNPVCTPSRSSFLTGRYPVTTRCRQNGQNFPDDEVLITRDLRDAGYDCGLAGKLHVSAAAEGSERRIDDGYRLFAWSHGATAKHGGDWVRFLQEAGTTFEQVYRRSDVILTREVTERAYHQTTWCVDRALAFMAEPREGPWLMSVNPFAPHPPFDILREFYDRYDPRELPPPLYRPGELEKKPRVQQLAHTAHGYPGGFAATAEEQRQQMVAAYYATVEHIDAEIGRLLDWLDETGERSRTLILFMSDHGDMLGDHGLMQKGPFFYEGAVRVPLIFCWPGRLASGLRSDALVELVDLAPTLYKLLGMPVPRRVQGKSLLPILTGQAPADEHRPGVYCEFYNSNPPLKIPRTYATMWRDRSHKIVIHHGEAVGELYDLERDPQEFENRWDDPAYREIRHEMMQRAFDARVFAMDPLPERVSYF